MKEVKMKIYLPECIYQLGLWVVLNYRRVRYGDVFRIIPLTQGLRAIVSPEDYCRLAKYTWYASRCRNTWYAQRSVKLKFGFKRHCHVGMHRDVLFAQDDKFVDHQNHNGLDNRRSNLRISTPAQNGWNRRKTSALCSSSFKGVCWAKRERMWHSQIKENGRQVTIGYFDDEEAAARAYDAKAKELYGEFAALNFPENERDPLGEWSFRICYGKYTG